MQSRMPRSAAHARFWAWSALFYMWVLVLSVCTHTPERAFIKFGWAVHGAGGHLPVLLALAVQTALADSLKWQRRSLWCYTLSNFDRV